MMWLFNLICLVQPVDVNYLETLYARQDPKSLSKQLYFYTQHPDTPQGQIAKDRILNLLKIENIDPLCPINLDANIFNQLLNALFKTDQSSISLNSESLRFLDAICQKQKHRHLKGHQYVSISELERSSIEDIDVSRGMFLLAFENNLEKTKAYEAVLDFMALCIEARLTPQSTLEQIVHEMNHFIFHELGYRFPAYSEHEDKIDTFTFLPSVLDNRQGVCLGVSLLYYSLAQRLGLDLTIYTPPGHIFLSLHENLNIETTARGIHMPIKRYLSLHIKELKKRNQKELLGMALFNQASVFIKNEKYHQAAKIYEKALKFIPDDPQILELLGSCYYMNRQFWNAHQTFTRLKKIHSKTYLSSNFVIDDYFKKTLTPDSLKAVFQDVEPQMQSHLAKAKQLEAIHKSQPASCSVLYQLAVTYLQLRQYEKAYQTLEKLYPQASQDPVVVYYLTELALIRYDRDRTLYYQDKLEQILHHLGYRPQAAETLFEEIQQLWPRQ